MDGRQQQQQKGIQCAHGGMLPDGVDQFLLFFAAKYLFHICVYRIFLRPCLQV